MVDKYVTKPDLNSIIADLDKRLRMLESGRNLTNSAIDNGTLRTKNIGGLPVVTLGVQQYGDNGMTVARDGGQPALRIASPGVGQPQQTALLDKSGNPIFSDSVYSPYGYEAPFTVPLQQRSANTPVIETTSSTTYVDLIILEGVYGPAFLHLEWMSALSVPSTASYRVVDKLNANAVLTGYFQPAQVKTNGTYTGGGYVPMQFDYNLWLGSNVPGTACKLALQANVTSGSVSTYITKAVGASA